jgi:putative oxidoreductase
MSFQRIVASHAPASVVLIRLAVGAVFLSEGVQKFLYPAELAAGRFAKIGLPSPEFLGPFVACFEIACGAAMLAGFLTRLAAVPLVTIMLVALASTKVPILLNKGFWTMAHEARTDWSMLLGSLFLLIVGAGRWSLDAVLKRRLAKRGCRESLGARFPR